MRVKRVPEPPDDIGVVREVYRAIPLVPVSETDCCARVMDHAGVSSRDAARVWITFLQGLGLVAEHQNGFVRRKNEETDLYSAFLEGVYGAYELLEILDSADRPLSVSELWDDFQMCVPRWEQYRAPGYWETEWKDRMTDLLGWLVLLEYVERADDTYRRS